MNYQQNPPPNLANQLPKIDYSSFNYKDNYKQNHAYNNRQNSKNRPQKMEGYRTTSKPYHKAPNKVEEMERAFYQRFYPGGVNQNQPSQNPQNTTTESGQNQAQNQDPQNSTNNLSNMAPILGMLGGNQNPQLGSLINAFSNGNMDVNKLVSTINNMNGSSPVSSMGGSESNNSMPNLLNLLGSGFNNQRSSNSSKNTSSKPKSSGNIKKFTRVD